MAQLQCVNNKVAGKVYTRYRVEYPRDIVERAGWNAKQRLTFRVDAKRNVIVTAAAPKEKPKKTTFEEFRDAVIQIVRSDSTKDWTWCRIRSVNSALPKTPSALWVDKMERECGLERVNGPNGMIWQLGLPLKE